MLDLMEGRLTPPEQAALHLFLEQNPDLDESIPTLNTLDAENVSFDYKDGILFEEINEENRGFFFISAAEGLLDNQQTEKLETFLLNFPQYKKETDQYKRATLIPESITFTHKNNLIFEQDKGVLVSIRRLRYIAAAVVLFIFSYGVLQLIQTDVQPKYSPIALALDEVISIPNQEDVLINVSPLESNYTQSTAVAKTQPRKNNSSPIEEIEGNPIKNVDQNMAHIPDEPMKKNDSVSTIKTGIIPNNDDIANNSNPLQLPSTTNKHAKAPTVGELLVQNAKDKLYNNPNAPTKDDFDSEIAALASAGISAVSNKEQYINRNVNDTKKTKVSIGGFSFERTTH